MTLKQGGNSQIMHTIICHETFNGIVIPLFSWLETKQKVYSEISYIARKDPYTASQVFGHHWHTKL